MGTLDWIVFALFIGYVVWDGMRRAVGAKDLEGYYAGGRGPECVRKVTRA